MDLREGLDPNLIESYIDILPRDVIMLILEGLTYDELNSICVNSLSTQFKNKYCQVLLDERIQQLKPSIDKANKIIKDIETNSLHHNLSEIQTMVQEFSAAGNLQLTFDMRFILDKNGIDGKRSAEVGAIRGDNLAGIIFLNKVYGLPHSNRIDQNIKLAIKNNSYKILNWYMTNIDNIDYLKALRLALDSSDPINNFNIVAKYKDRYLDNIAKDINDPKYPNKKMALKYDFIDIPRVDDKDVAQILDELAQDLRKLGIDV